MSAPPSLTPPPDPPAGPAAGHWDVAKWLIPSVGALFIIVGYVAKRAHYAYLGFSPGLLEPNQYIATAADFFRYLPIMTLADIQKLTEERPELFYSRSGSFLTPSRQEVPEMPSEENTLDTAKSQGG